MTTTVDSALTPGAGHAMRLDLSVEPHQHVTVATTWLRVPAVLVSA